MQEALEDHQKMSGAPSSKDGGHVRAPRRGPADEKAGGKEHKDAGSSAATYVIPERSKLNPLQREYIRLCGTTCQPDPTLVEAIT